MGILENETIFIFVLLLYIFAAILSVVFSSKPRVTNYVMNGICSLSGLIGVFFSLGVIFSDEGKLNIKLFETSTPYFSGTVSIDKLSAFFIGMLSLLVICVSIYSLSYLKIYYGKRNIGVFGLLYSTFILSMILVFTASNTIFFFVNWEIMAVISYFLVIFEKEKNDNQKAGSLYIIMTHIATALIMIAFLIIFSYTKSFNVITDTNMIPKNIKDILFILFLIGFGTKAGIVPVHIWMPKAYSAAPGNITALLSGIMSKTAIYGIIRFVLGLLGVQNISWGVIILFLGMITAVVGVSFAYIEKNMTRQLAFSSIENIGIAFIGIGICFIANARNNIELSALAMLAVLIHVFNHAIFKGSLFMGAGSILYSTGTTNMEELGGLTKKMPVTSVLMLISVIAASALVPFNGFIGEWMLLQSIFKSILSGLINLNILFIVTVASLALAAALAAASFVKLFGITFLGKSRSNKALNVKEVPAQMQIGMGILTFFCIFFGVFPIAIFRVLDKVVYEILGLSLLEKLNGGIFVLNFPLTSYVNSISIAGVIVAVLLIIGLIILTLFIVGGKYVERKYGTWDCGFKELSTRMQYSSVGFSKSLSIVFKFLLRPSRELKSSGGTQYHPEKMEYFMENEPIFERFIYNPIEKWLNRISKIARFKLQTGSIHSYLTYIFITVLIMMLYNRLI